MRPTIARAGRPATLLAAVLAVAAACSSDGRELAEPVFPPPATEPSPEPTSPITPATVDLLPSEPLDDAAASEPAEAGSAGSVVIDLLSSPANATAEIVGTGAAPGDPITVDGAPADVLSFEVDPTGSFVAQVWIEQEGPHTVCVAATCGRVFTLAPDAETAEQVEAKIAEATDLARAILPFDQLFPEWTVEIGGALSGTGGTTDADRRVVTIYRNRGRSVDDFVRTILHEFGHVVDAERLDEAARASYLDLAGYPADAAWSDPAARRLEDWARQPAEDFAEVLVAGWTDRRWLPRTRAETSDELIAAAFSLAALDD